MTAAGSAPRIVVGVDGSEDSLRAVAWAAADAGRRHLALHLVRASAGTRLSYPPPGLALPVALQPVPGEAEHAARLLAAAVVRARDVAVDVVVSSEAVDERPVPALLAASRHAAEVVVGGRGAGGFTRLLTGSTAAQLADHATCPVVVVRPRTGPAGPNAARVLLGIDASACAAAAVRYAFEQAAFRRVGLTAIHAYELPTALERDGILPPRYDQEELRLAERRALVEALSGMSERYPDVDVRLETVAGHAAGVVVGAAAGAELVVVGARGHEGFAGLLLGSVARAVLHHAPCPVAIVRP